MSQSIKWLSEHMTRRRMSFVTVGLSLIIGTGIYQGTKDEVTLDIDGKKQVIRTHVNTVEQLLLEQNVNQENVMIEPGISTEIEDQLVVKVQQANHVSITVDGEVKKVFTVAKNVREVLESQGIVLGNKDKIQPSIDQGLVQNMNININRSFPITLQVNGIKKKVETISTTVADFLKVHNVQYSKQDRIEPALTETIQKNYVVKVVKIEKATDVVEEVIAMNTVSKPDSKLRKGTTKIIQKGKQGKIVKKYEITKEDGVVKKKKLVEESIVQKMVPKIIAVGLKIPSRGELAGKEYYVESTAYTPYCNGCSGTTASGVNIRSNPNMKLIAVDPNFIPLGTKVYVEGYGYAIAADTGGAIKGNKIDVLMPTESAAYRWGRKVVKIRIIG